MTSRTLSANDLDDLHDLCFKKRNDGRVLIEQDALFALVSEVRAARECAVPVHNSGALPDTPDTDEQ